ncbi:hypothetical protein D9756_002741 [Leucocoprinus leucothites]|uniref:Nephrocystin 3-like N-terminal domain-containing protein n=1 Tax=Leucocoprinus leucothites TaxID=201217 RepID=A0A8H5GBK8_9AGAR|nr:hypothetical protein D9756_002741 [Leucoagaricus leucothites]
MVPPDTDFLMPYQHSKLQRFNASLPQAIFELENDKYIARPISYPRLRYRSLPASSTCWDAGSRGNVTQQLMLVEPSVFTQQPFLNHYVRLKSHRAPEDVSKSVEVATTAQTQEPAGNRRQHVLGSSANAGGPQANEQAAQGTQIQCFKDSNYNESQTRSSEQAKDTGSTSVSVSSDPMPQESLGSSRPHTINNAMTATSHIQDTGNKDHGQKLKVLVEGLEFVPLAKECMADTRVGILSDVDTRIRDNEDSNVIWIKGFPGVGKSALASTIVSRLRERGELLSYFIFDRAKPTATTTTALWRRVAWDLARLHPFARRSLLERIDNETLDVNTPNIGTLFTSLIIEPLSDLRTDASSDVQLRQPVVVVIDAADECGGLEGSRSDDRKALLKTLVQWHSELPKNFKLVVTSREEDDIRRRISPISTHIHISIATDEASSDVRKYLEDRLGDIADAYAELPVDWLRQTADRLAKRAAGVFIWATTIANFIEAGEPQSRLEDIDAGLGLGGEEGSLYALYATILKISFKNVHRKEMEAFKTVVGAMIFAQRPFHDSEFAAISPVVTGSMLEYIRNGLRSVIDQGSTLRFIHQSFVDFLLSPECPNDFAIKEPEQQRQLSALCLTTMSKELRFNICGLETSSLKNVDVLDIEMKVQTGIPPLLSYSCCFVAEHLRHTAFDEHLIDDVRVVFKEKLLYWLEVMSLLKEMNRAVPILRAILVWIPTRDGDLTEFVHDALRFVAAFTIPIIQSAPHIYLSALPFAPEQSLVAKYFLPKFPRLLTLDTGKPSHWSSCVFVSEHHRHKVTSITLSPDETIFVSGDIDGTICIWDFETGILTSGPFIQPVQGGSDGISSLDFSPDGKHVVATYGGTQAVVWDVESGEEHLCFGQSSERSGSAPGESENIVSAVYSKDGNMIVSLSKYCIACDDLTHDCDQGCFCRIRQWDASSGTLAHILVDIPRPNDGYFLSPGAHFLAILTRPLGRLLRIWDLTARPPGCVIELDGVHFPSSWSPLVFSPDGNFLLFVDCTAEDVSMAYIWKMDSCTLVGPALALGPDNISSYYVLYLYGNDDLAIGVHSPALTQIFDATTGTEVYHGKEPTNVSSSFPSRSGRRVLLGYYDGTIRMWDYPCHMEALPPIDSTTDDPPKSLRPAVVPVFSPCGKALVVSYEDEIKLWSTTTGEVINLNCPIQTRHDVVAFSGNGRYIASLTPPDRDHNELPVINIWDANTGLNHHRLVVALGQNENYSTLRWPKLFFRPGDNRLTMTSPLSGSPEHWVVHVWGDNMPDEPCATVTLPCPENLITGSSASLLSPDGLTALIHERTPTGLIFHCLYRGSVEDQFTPHPLFDAPALGAKICGDFGWTAFSPSGQLFVSVLVNTGEPLQIRVWETKTWTEVAGPFETGEIVEWAPKESFAYWPRLLSISPDNHFIHFVSPQYRALWIWDIRTGCLVAGPWYGYDLRHATESIISPDGEKLASMFYDGSATVRLWDIRGLDNGNAQEQVGGVGGFGDQTLVEDGWVKEEGGNSLLFWVPVEHREKLWRPRHIAFIGETPTKLNFSKFKYGKDWEECIDEEYATRTQVD